MVVSVAVDPPGPFNVGDHRLQNTGIHDVFVTFSDAAELGPIRVGPGETINISECRRAALEREDG